MYFRGASDILHVDLSMDTSDIVEILHPTKQIQQNHACPGQIMAIPSHAMPWWSYPVGMHPRHPQPWKVELSDEGVVLKSKECTGQPSGSFGPCDQCANLLKTNDIQNIMERNKHGMPAHTPYEWLTWLGMNEVIQRKARQINQLKLHILNITQTLSIRMRHLDGYKRFVLAIGQRDIP